MKSIYIKPIYLLFIFIVLSLSLHAQPEDNGGDPPPVDVPLDGGTGLLISAGIAYGVRSIKKRKEKNRRE